MFAFSRPSCKTTAPNVCSRKRQSIVRASFTNACFISMIWSSRERNRSCSLVSRRSRGRIANPPLHQLEREESRLAIRRNPQNRICKEVALQRPKTGKFDYLSAPNHPAHSMAFKFFTDDDVWRQQVGQRTPRSNATPP